MDEEEVRFANNVFGATDVKGDRTAWVTVTMVAALLVSLILWAHFAEVEQITGGQGKVIPSSQVQVVESLEAGIVAELMVGEGDAVDVGQPLLRIDDTGFAARLGEFNQKQISLKAELLRLRAEAGRASQIEQPTDMKKESLRAFQDQQAIFKVNQIKLKQQSLVRKHQLSQKEQSVAEIVANENKQKGSLKLLARELKLSERLFKRRAITELEILRLRRGASEMRADINVLAASKARIEAEVAELEVQLDADVTQFLSEVQARISNVNTEISVVNESIRAAGDRVARTVLRSPVKGIVNRLNVAAVGEVVNAGVTILEIVPVGDKLLIEARIRPQDIGFIAPGLPAIIRLSAYDYTKYGSLKGKVERIGANTITDENNETFYQVIVSTNNDDSGRYGKELRIIPGMIASVDVAIGKRSILNYLMKPILKITNKALRDPS